MIIAIDGLGVNGKSTIAKKLSDELDIKYFNTGAIYRCIALKIINENLDIMAIDKTLDKIENMNVDFISNEVILDGVNVTQAIRREDVSVKSTEWATIPEVKKFVQKIQKQFLKNNSVVIEGRDICTRIAPNAEYKFYLYSEFETRVERLWNTKKDIPIDIIRQNLKIRDDLDINGGNFIKPDDAINIDTTNLSLEQVYNIILNTVKGM